MGIVVLCVLILERLFLKKWLEKVPVLSNIYLLVVVILGWVIFRFSDLSLGMALVKSMFGLNGNALTAFTSRMQLQSHLYLLIVCCIVCTPLAKWLKGKMETVTEGTALGKVWDVVFYSLIPAILLLLSTACLVGDSYNPFIYFQF